MHNLLHLTRLTISGLLLTAFMFLSILATSGAVFAADAIGNPDGSRPAGTLDIFGEGARVLPGVPDDVASSSPEAAFSSWLANVLSISMVVATLAVFFYWIWGAFDWNTSGGDKGKLETARNKITQAIIGLVVLAASAAILMIVQDLLNICVLEIGAACAQDSAAAPPAVGFCGGGVSCNGLSKSLCTTPCVWTEAN